MTKESKEKKGAVATRITRYFDRNHPCQPGMVHSRELVFEGFCCPAMENAENVFLLATPYFYAMICCPFCGEKIHYNEEKVEVSE
jgi:hypothetical protein